MQLIAIVFLLVSMFSAPMVRGKLFSVQAQTEDTVLQVDQFTVLQQKYFRLLEQYRQQEQAYFIAKNQFIQLNTLAAQELAVKETRTLIDIRADVLLTHLDILMLLLQRTTSVPLEYKNPQLVNLGLLKEKLQLHKNRNLATQDRLSLDAEASEFVGMQPEIEQEIYYTLTMIRVGRVQTAIDKLVTVRDAVKTEIESQNMSPSIQAEKTRGFDEIERTLTQVNVTFEPIRNSSLRRENNNSLQAETELSKSLTPTFALINQTVKFLQEIRN